ncbi:MAG: hypothetical protein MRY78_14945 [Saprospiraceae bacterium]|nr:hypothetical protein [Saprospiraceae bacterium]
MLIDKIRISFRQFFFTLLSIPKSIEFIRDHKLWQGFSRYSWVSRFLLIIAVLLGLKFLSIAFSAFDSESASVFGMMGNMITTAPEKLSEVYSFLFDGGMRYAMLFLLEVLIFHVSRRTLEILIQKEGDTSFNTFINAQIRMFKVVLRAWITEIIIVALLNVALGFVSSPEFVKETIAFFIGCYFLGLPILDNYFEQFNMTIKESFKYAQEYIGIALAAGLVVKLAFYIPVAGPIIAPFVVAVTVSLVLYDLSDLHLLGGKLATKLTEYDEQ